MVLRKLGEMESLCESLTPMDDQALERLCPLGFGAMKFSFQGVLSNCNSFGVLTAKRREERGLEDSSSGLFA